LRELSEKHTLISYGRPIIEFGIQCVPYLLVWMLFTFIYSFLPNTRVKFKAALFGGVISGTIFLVLQMGYVLVQMALSRYNVIYGSFSALPLFLIWMYLNWLIMLFGVTLCYLYQHFDYDSKRARDCDRTPADKRMLALMLAAEVTNEFAEGEKPSTAVELSRKLDISESLTNELLYKLVQCNVLCQIAGAEYDSPSYRPGMPLEKMDIVNTLQKYDQWAEPGDIPAVKTALGANTVRSIELLKGVMANSSANRPLTDLLKK
jgi:membrane protein